jgi:hypothetical protein
MEERALMFAIFGVIEHVTKAELTNIAKTLIYNYYKSSERPTARERARDVVFRYAQCKSLPALEDIRRKTRDQLDKLEHLVLRMDYEAMRIDGTLPAHPAEPADNYSPPVPPAPLAGSGPFRVDEPKEAEPPAAPSPDGTPAPTVRKTPLASGGFSGVKAKPLSRPPSGPKGIVPKPKARAAATPARAGKSRSTARPGTAAKRPGVRKAGPGGKAKKSAARKTKKR